MSSKAMGDVQFRVNPKVPEHPSAIDALLPMGITSENVAERFHVSRAKQDAFAAESHRRAGLAQQAGRFAAEIVPTKAVEAVG